MLPAMAGTPLDARTRGRLERYLEELYLWVPRLNLTTVPRAQAWSRHVEESLLLLEFAALRAAARVCDLGSGAGLPGIPIAIARPDVHVVLCDSDQRRCGFLTHVCGVLGLANTTVIAERAEVLGRAADARATFDAVVSRAVASPPVVCELALPLLRVGGIVCVLVGDAAEAAAQSRAAALACGGAEPHIATPGVMTVEKVAATPDRFPRRVGIPAKRPLG